MRNFIKRFFIPSAENNYKAKALHTDFLTLYLVSAITISLLIGKLGVNFTNVLGYATDITVQKLFEDTNNEREKNGLSDLSYNSKLEKAAKDKADDMFKKDYWAHYAPDGATPWSFILGEGYKYEYAGENLAKNFMFSDGVVNAWMNSPSHRENILRKEYSEVGLAIANGVLNGEPTTLVVQMFGKPLSLADTSDTGTLTKETVPIKTVQEESRVLSDSSINKSQLKPSVIFNANILFILFLSAVLILDFYIASRMNIIRLSGKNIAHLIFLLFVVAGLFILTKGAII